MKEFLEEVFDVQKHDGFTFTPIDSKDESYFATEIKAFNYSDAGEPVPGSELGEKYHVIVYRENEKGEVSHQDHFCPIIGDPVYYGSRLIENGWFGLICKKTTTSESYINKIYSVIVNPT